MRVVRTAKKNVPSALVSRANEARQHRAAARPAIAAGGCWMSMAINYRTVARESIRKARSKLFFAHERRRDALVRNGFEQKNNFHKSCGSRWIVRGTITECFNIGHAGCIPEIDASPIE